MEWGEHIPIGILYHRKSETYEDRMGLTSSQPLVLRKTKRDNMESSLKEFYE